LPISGLLLYGSKSLHLATVKLCTASACSQKADRKALSLKVKYEIPFLLGGKKVIEMKRCNERINEEAETNENGITCQN
jgi:hypothetical protein